ncbi:MAG: hypothetical protein JOS17DRAFT_789697 [Linnemannia elongata]|nr:MAG: hypothetical protein JOS17DRAFT_789695 [Linnemannia elongata]KAK3832988.1 MAG: hypothetical protein JOS17DRAFT_789697 [Linnemannia elongata]
MFMRLTYSAVAAIAALALFSSVGNALPTPTEATTYDQVPSLDASADTFNNGGAHLGRGAAELVSAAAIGAPQIATAFPCEVLGDLAPGHCAFTNDVVTTD